nr:copia protein [Tanacetum cinerariifolium]
MMPITTAKEKAQRRLEVKARSTLMMGIPNEHLLKFNSIKDAKQLLEAVEKRFVNTAHGVSSASTQVNAVYIDNLNDVFICSFFASQQRRKLTVNGNKTIGFDKSNVECYNCHKRGHFAREYRAPRNQDNTHKESSKRSVPIDTNTSKALVLCDGLGGYDWSAQAEEGPNYAPMAFTSTSFESKNNCNYHQKQFQNQKMVKPIWNNAQRVNYQNFVKKTYPCAKKNMVLRALLMNSGLVSVNTARPALSVNTARQVNVAHSNTKVNATRSMSYLFKIAHSNVKRPIHKNITFENSNINQRVNTARPKAVVNAVKGNKEDINTFNFLSDHEDDGEMANMNNLDTTIYLQDVWTLVDLPNEKRAIGTKWVFRNKKDERGIMIRNKARLIDQGHTQEEKIDYNEVFSPAARIEAIRLFIAYASFKDFVVYQMDVKSAFLYEKIEEEVYVCQPPGFEDPNFSDRVYKVKKALYG